MPVKGCVHGPLSPKVPNDEFELRSKLRSYRNAASAMIASTQCDTSRLLAWEVVSWATHNLYAAVPFEWLERLNALAKQLMLAAMQAEEMHLLSTGGGHD